MRLMLESERRVSSCVDGKRKMSRTDLCDDRSCVRWEGRREDGRSSSFGSGRRSSGRVKSAKSFAHQTVFGRRLCMLDIEPSAVDVSPECITVTICPPPLRARLKAKNTSVLPVWNFRIKTFIVAPKAWSMRGGV